MSDTRVLISKISSLRERLEKARGKAGGAAFPTEPSYKLAPSAPSQSPEEGDESPAVLLQKLEKQVLQGNRHNALLEDSLRQLADEINSAAPAAVPARLTGRAMHVLERGRELVGRLRGLANDMVIVHGEDPSDAFSHFLSDPANPLAVLFRETTAMAETSMRVVQAFPNSTGGQLRLCEGLETVLDVIAEKTATLGLVLERRRREKGWVDLLADVLVGLNAGKSVSKKSVVSLAEIFLEDARQAQPLRLLHGEHVLNPLDPARLVARHGLVVAQIIARVVVSDAKMRESPLDPLLAALLHDVGMLRVPAEILRQPTPLTDEQRRIVERHSGWGAEIIGRSFAELREVADATASHHERLDGTGYPAGSTDTQIKPLARLLAVGDIYAALCSPRSYRPARETRTALTDTLMMAESGTLDRYDAERLLVLTFYPLGTVVELSDGSWGVVVAHHQDSRALHKLGRPVVALMTDAEEHVLPALLHVDLGQGEGRSIVRSLQPAEYLPIVGRNFPAFLL